MFVHAPQLSDEFVGVVPTKAQDKITLLIYNYIDPDIARNYISRNIALLNEKERKSLLAIMGSDKLDKILRRQIDAAGLSITARTKAMLKKAQELNDSAARFSAAGRNIKIVLKNLKDDQVYERYTVDSACNSNCAFVPVESDQPVTAAAPAIPFVLNPYSVNVVVLTKKPKEAERPKEIEKAFEEASKQKEEPEQAAEALKSQEAVKPKEAEKPKEPEAAEAPKGMGQPQDNTAVAGPEPTAAK